jgi:hypothetical protein
MTKQKDICLQLHIAYNKQPLLDNTGKTQLDIEGNVLFTYGYRISMVLKNNNIVKQEKLFNSVKDAFDWANKNYDLSLTP